MPRMGAARRQPVRNHNPQQRTMADDESAFLSGFQNTLSAPTLFGAAGAFPSQTNSGPSTMSFESLGGGGSAHAQSAPHSRVQRGAAQRGGSGAVVRGVPGASVSKGPNDITDFQELKRRVMELTRLVDRWDRKIDEIGEATFQVIGTTVVNVPYYTNKPKTLSDLRNRTGVVPAKTRVSLMYPQETTNEVVLMRMRTCDPMTGSCAMFFLPVGRMSMTDEEMYAYLGINANLLPDKTRSQSVTGFHIPGTRDPLEASPDYILPQRPLPSSTAARGGAGDDDDNNEDDNVEDIGDHETAAAYGDDDYNDDY